MNGAFEDAFYQLDSNRDGVVTVADLERYVRDNNLKDKFIQKWLTLFGDDKNVIYYDKFCETMGIVPAVDKFEQKTYKIDMTEETKKEVTDIIKEFLMDDNELDDDSLNAIREKLADVLGDSWSVTLDPKKSDINVKYAPDGLLYYSPTTKEIPKILVYRECPPLRDLHPEIVYKKDMSDETQAVVQNIINQHKSDKGNITANNLEDITNDMERNLGDKWGVVLNPSPEEIHVPYKDDGILYYSLDETENPKILVWRKDALVDKFQPTTYKADMSDETKKVVMSTIEEFRQKDKTLADDTQNAIDKRLARLLGDKWMMKVDPSINDLDIEYSNDGMLFYSPSITEHPKLLVYREAKPMVNGDGKELIYESIMSESAKDSVLAIVRRNYNPVTNKLPKVEKIIKELNIRHGQTWNIVINPSEKNLQVEFDFDGKIYFSPNSKEDIKILIWRQDKEKTRGKMCFCCF